MTTKKQWWKDQGVLLSDFKRLNPWFRTEKDEKFITNEKINFETNGAPLPIFVNYKHKTRDKTRLYFFQFMVQIILKFENWKK